mmetsp:Transcript_262/g.2083  ORF Transcript_262/g.2083 Transcript_262/m.2083 type:complete len:131 (+) Transcript_262:555-947(+)
MDAIETKKHPGCTTHAEMIEPKVGLVVIQTCTLLVLATARLPPGPEHSRLTQRKASTATKQLDTEERKPRRRLAQMRPAEETNGTRHETKKEKKRERIDKESCPSYSRTSHAMYSPQGTDSRKKRLKSRE